MKELILITEDTKFRNIVTSDIELSNSSTLTIEGIVNGQITIRHSSILIIYGIVNGSIINEGLCKIYGTLNGIRIDQGGEFIIDTGAVINPVLRNF